MRKLKAVNEVQDVKIGKSDFILQHKKAKFQVLYKVDNDKIIG